MKRNWDVAKLATTSRTVYYGVGKAITVIAVRGSTGERFTCLTCRKTDACEHADAVADHVATHAQEAA